MTLQLPWQPLWYHGHSKRRNFFEGWYFKWISPDEQHAFAIIPGIAKEPDGQQHAFIQVMDGKAKTAQYHRFEAEAFQASTDAFEVQIEGNFFSADRVVLDLPELKGEVYMQNLTPWPWKWYAPGIMGPFSFVPMMQCYHGVVSMDHSLHGELQYQGNAIDMHGGRGYGEKDWGRSFPSSWIWMQTNHFEEPGISLSASVAMIPWLHTSFVGFIAGLWVKDRLYRFATYTGAKLVDVRVEDGNVYYALADRTKRLQIVAHHAAGTDLRSPVKGLMEGRVNESMEARIDVQLFEKGQLIFEGTGRNAGLEVAGEVEELM
ncbi:MAG: tocopherol cyclase family protein [Bacteroidota bacterium]